jgi:hypothetical protein
VKIVTNSIPNNLYIALFIDFGTKSIRYHHNWLPDMIMRDRKNRLLESANPYCGSRFRADFCLMMGIFVSSGRISPLAGLMWQKEIPSVKAQNAPASLPLQGSRIHRGYPDGPCTRSEYSAPFGQSNIIIFVTCNILLNHCHFFIFNPYL